MKLRHEPSLYELYSVVGSYKDLLAYYEGHKKMKTEDEIRKRMDYVLKHKLKQMGEIETLKWVLGDDVDEKDFYKTDNASRSN